MRISEFAEMTGLTSRQIRYWTDEGLLVSQRLTNTYRDYDGTQVSRAHRIAALFDAGLTLKEVKAISKCLDFDQGICPTERDTLQTRLNQISAKIACMQYTQTTIESILRTPSPAG